MRLREPGDPLPERRAHDYAGGKLGFDHKNGDEVPIQDSAAPIRDRIGNIIGSVMVFHDVSKRLAPVPPAELPGIARLADRAD